MESHQQRTLGDAERPERGGCLALRGLTDVKPWHRLARRPAQGGERGQVEADRR